MFSIFIKETNLINFPYKIYGNTIKNFKIKLHCKSIMKIACIRLQSATVLSILEFLKDQKTVISFNFVF